MQAQIVSRDAYLERLASLRGPSSLTGGYLGTLSAAGGSIVGPASRGLFPNGNISQMGTVDAFQNCGMEQSGPAGGLGVAVQPLAAANHFPGAQNQVSFGSKAPKNRRVKDNFVNRVVEQSGPAVVRVEIEQKVEMPAMDDADIFSFFFGVKPHAKQQERKIRGHGSGFCVDGVAGVILTNAHVVQDADYVSVTFAGSPEPLECEILETDEAIDVAAIRVKHRPKSPLPSMPLGDSESLRTGDWAIVLGNPLGLQNTCTLGIISSLDRSTGETGFDWMRHPLLQTDAAVNQGNSGGPMLNENGEVVGMISMRALFGEGIGFAIPTGSIKTAMASLLQRKKVPRAFVGIKMTATAPNGSDRRRGSTGAFVDMVVPRSPAEKAGFEVDDQILEVDGQKIRHFEDVQVFVRSAKVGVQATFKVKRGESTQTLRVLMADIRQLRDAQAANGRSPQRHGQPRVLLIPQR